MPPVITALYGALNAVFNIALALRVSRLRAKYSVSLGTGTSDQLAVAIRQHANNAEYLPLALVMLLICELCGGDKTLMHVLGGALLAGRVFHAVGLPGKQWNVWRFLGSSLTYFGILGSAGYALYLRFSI